MATLAAGDEPRARRGLAVRLKQPLVAQVLLFVSLLGTFGAFNYPQTAPLIEVSRVCVLALFVGLAFFTRLNSRWITRILLPALLAGSLVLLYAHVFTLKTGAPLLPSILAQRGYVYFLLGPVVYMLYLRGWRLRDFQQIFLAAMLVSVFVLAAYDIVPALLFDTQSLLLSGSFFTLELGEVVAESTVFRVVNTSALFLTLYFGRRLLQTRDPLTLGFTLGATALSVALMAISLPRSVVASVCAALVLYAILLARPWQAKLTAILIPLYLLGFAIFVPSAGGALLEAFDQDRSFQTRVETSDIAWESFLEYPLLGFGQDSAQSISFQSLFGPNFFPSDIGLLGVAFEYGLVGVALYLSLLGWLCWNLLKLVWVYADAMEPGQRAFLWTLLIVCLSFLIAFPLQARALYSNGLPIAAFAWGLILAHRHGASAAPARDEPRREPGTRSSYR